MNDKELFTRYFREVQPKFARLCVRTLRRTHLTLAQFGLLSVLAAGEAMPMTEVSSKLHITKPAVTNLVDRLEKHGYIKRAAQKGDRRVHMLQLQAKGKKMVRSMQSAILAYLLKALEEFQPKERQTVIRFYETLSKTMDEFLIKPKK